MKEEAAGVCGMKRMAMTMNFMVVVVIVNVIAKKVKAKMISKCRPVASHILSALFI